MGQVLVNEQYLKDTANEIKRQLNVEDPIKPSEFSSKISLINPNYIPNQKGFVINKINELNGKPTDVSFVGYTTLPKYSFYYAIDNNGIFTEAFENIHLPNDLKIIGECAFYGCSKLRTLVLSDTIEKLESNCFCYCNNLRLEKLPKNLKTIGSSCFNNCSNLLIKELPSTVSSIGSYAFNGCSKITLEELNNPLQEIPDYCFCNSGVKFKQLPNTISRIGQYAFSWCKNLMLEELPEELTYIGSCAFQTAQNITISKIPDNVTTIGQYAFADCTNLKRLKLPKKLASLGQYAFQSCSNITDIELPETMKTIPNYCFQYCTSLESLVCLGDISSVGSYCLYGCKSLTYLSMPCITKVPTNSSSNNLYNTNLKNGYIEVPNNLVESFKTTSYWSTYKDNIIGLTLKSLYIDNDEINLFKNNLEIIVLYNAIIKNGEALGEYAGYTLTCSDNATLDGNILILNEGVQAGDIVTVTATSTYNPEITTTKEISVYYKAAYYELNLNNGQWVDSGTTIDGNIVYKSDAGSYNTDNGKSIATITVEGLTLLKLYIRSYAESTYDYTEAFEIDKDPIRGNGKFTTTGAQSSSTYKECVYNLDGEIHTINIMYSKDGSGHTNDDRGYFYIGEWK